MKRIIRLVSVAFLFLFAGTLLNGQCEADVVTCKDDGVPGEICPEQLQDALKHEPYEAVITVIAPGEFTLGETTIVIEYIMIDSIVNLPDGLSFEANTDKFWADSAFCINISGTPVGTGEFPLSIYVTPWIMMEGNIIPGAQVLDDTSVTITVLAPVGIDPDPAQSFRVISSFPNPFPDVTRIGFSSPFEEQVELAVYNILGVKIYEEQQVTSPGEYFFDFDGLSLKEGAYIYRISNNKEVFTRRFIKARK